MQEERRAKLQAALNVQSAELAARAAAVAAEDQDAAAAATEDVARWRAAEAAHRAEQKAALAKLRARAGTSPHRAKCVWFGFCQPQDLQRRTPNTGVLRRPHPAGAKGRTGKAARAHAAINFYRFKRGLFC